MTSVSPTAKRRRRGDHTVRAALYIRVSSEEQIEGFSLSAQHRIGREYIASQGWHLVHVYRDEGRSARSDSLHKRPAFRQMLGDAEDGQFDIVVCHKLDRFSRHLGVAVDAFRRLDHAAVDFLSITEGGDGNSPHGRLLRTIMLGLAEFYSSNLSAETSKGKQERKKQGLYCGLLPFGTAKGPDGIPIIDKEAKWCDRLTKREVVPGEGLRLAFDEAGLGKSDRDVAERLNALGYLTSGPWGNRRFTKDSVRMILQNRFYLGELPDGNGGWIPGKHDAMIDPAVFAKAARTRARHGTNRLQRFRTRSNWSLSGIARCQACGGSMRSTGGTAEHPRIVCSNRVQSGTCDQASLTSDRIDDQLAVVLGAFAIPVHDGATLLEYVAERMAQPTGAAAERARLDRKLERLKELYLDGDVDQLDFHRQRREVQAALAALPLDDVVDPAALDVMATYLTDLATAWAQATAGERNNVMRDLFDAVWIEDRTVVAVTPRAEVVPYMEYAACQLTGGVFHLRKRRDSNPRSQP
jgi:site-specific DNA recombinase